MYTQESVMNESIDVNGETSRTMNREFTANKEDVQNGEFTHKTSNEHTVNKRNK